MNGAALRGTRELALTMRERGTKILRVSTTYYPFFAFEVRHQNGDRTLCSTLASAIETATVLP